MLVLIGGIGFNVCKNMGKATEPKSINTFDVEYTENGDGTYKCRGFDFKYKKEVTGLENGKTTTFTVLTNNKEIDFDTVSRSLSTSEALVGEPEFIILAWY